MPKFMWRQGTYLRDIPHTFCCASDPLHIHEYDYSTALKRVFAILYAIIHSTLR